MKNSIIVGIAVLVILIFALVLTKSDSQILPNLPGGFKQISGNSFVFTAAGDYGAHEKRAGVVLSGINPTQSGANFHLALGDLSYAQKKTESDWCDFVKSKVGADFPFEIISGNHEGDGTSQGNFIDNYKNCLPHRLVNMTGDYSREYYFDYPDKGVGVKPVARFINISPGINFPEGKYNYTKGNAHYNWVVTAIDSARGEGIKWVIVSMHKNCISMGRKSCEIGTDIFNLLVEKKVDLILQGHDHNYQRSKQLTLGTNCIEIKRSGFVSGCVADDGQDHEYIKGKGTVLNIIGTGGNGNYEIAPNDSEAGFFAKWNGTKSKPTFGFLRAEVSDSQLSVSFVAKAGTPFLDHYTIKE